MLHIFCSKLSQSVENYMVYSMEQSGLEATAVNNITCTILVDGP